MNPKTITSLLTIPLAVLLLLATPAAVQAQFDYTVNTDNTITINWLHWTSLGCDHSDEH
jgi:hypothetical protein